MARDLLGFGYEVMAPACANTRGLADQHLVEVVDVETLHPYPRHVPHLSRWDNDGTRPIGGR